MTLLQKLKDLPAFYLKIMLSYPITQSHFLEDIGVVGFLVFFPSLLLLILELPIIDYATDGWVSLRSYLQEIHLSISRHLQSFFSREDSQLFSLRINQSYPLCSDLLVYSNSFLSCDTSTPLLRLLSNLDSFFLNRFYHSLDKIFRLNVLQIISVPFSRRYRPLLCLFLPYDKRIRDLI